MMTNPKLHFDHDHFDHFDHLFCTPPLAFINCVLCSNCLTFVVGLS